MATKKHKTVKKTEKQKIELTKRQKSFFHKPRTYDDILHKLFDGDPYAATAFQSKQINAGNLEVCLIEHPQTTEELNLGRIHAIRKSK